MVHWGWFVFVIFILLYVLAQSSDKKVELQIRIAELETELRLFREFFRIPSGQMPEDKIRDDELDI